LNNTCVKHNFKSVHVSNLFCSREYNSAKEICKYPWFSKVGGNYPLDLKIIWSSDYKNCTFCVNQKSDMATNARYFGKRNNRYFLGTRNLTEHKSQMNLYKFFIFCVNHKSKMSTTTSHCLTMNRMMFCTTSRLSWIYLYYRNDQICFSILMVKKISKLMGTLNETWSKEKLFECTKHYSYFSQLNIFMYEGCTQLSIMFDITFTQNH
jgi:hypothetical protein